MARIPAPPRAESSPREAAPEPRKAPAPGPGRGPLLADAVLVGAFLALTFLLGVFPLNDTDFWWHLRTGDLIRGGAGLPRSDWYTFGAADHAWIDLHWGFQVAISWLYSLGGVDATNLAKCIVTTAAVAILLFARRPGWPLWAMVAAWLPALLLLGGRMYVRPETLTLLYLAMDLAILFRIDRKPRLAWGLPFVQVFWVNSQGLFVFGPILIGMALVDAALRRGAFAPERKAWWTTILGATLATGLACLLNPYGIFGAMFPLQLVGTMSNPVFKGIMELRPIFDLMESVGLDNLMLQIHFTTLILGGLSFLVPMTWVAITRVADLRAGAPEPRRKKGRKKGAEPEPSWRLSAFRLMLYAAFSLLSFRATRNSHQFAAVVGTVTAWNFGEWAAAVASRRASNATAKTATLALAPRLAATTLVALAIVAVGSGRFYAWAGEGRTVGWGEKPLWFPHDAARFAGSDGMPDRFLVYHNGDAGVFEYHNGPDRKVFADARLEVMGPATYGEDMELGSLIASAQPGWFERVRRLGPPTPGVLVDHVQAVSSSVAATLLGDANWRCVYYDPIASVYLPRDASSPAPTVDFRARHFGVGPDAGPRGADALTQAARGLFYQAFALTGLRVREDRVAELITLGQGYARRALAIDPSSATAWRFLGQLESLRQVRNRVEPIPRTKLPFDPIHDLDDARATYDLLRSRRLDPGDFSAERSLFEAFFFREMYEEADRAAGRLIAAARPDQSFVIRQMEPAIGRARSALLKPAVTTWNNRGELERVVATLLDQGRTEAAADVLERAFAPAERTWEQSDRIATLRLHLGRPDLARRAWESATRAPRPALRAARVAVTHLVEGDLDAARRSFAAAIAAEPDLFEAHYGLAVLERDAGRAAAALAAASAAETSAASDVARSAAREIAEFVGPYAAADAAPPTR